MSAVPTSSRARFSTRQDLEECRRLHKKHGVTYYFASGLLPLDVRSRIHALYGFVRTPDEWVDNPRPHDTPPAQALDRYQKELLEGLEGNPPSSGVLRAFCDVALDSGMPVDEPLMFLDSMAQDLKVKRYESYECLRQYMRGSASAVGVMMCFLLDRDINPRALPYAMTLGEAMQMTNFLRDVGEDAGRGRIYLPLEHLDAFEVSEAEIIKGVMSPRFRSLMRYEIGRTRELYRHAEDGLAYLPPRTVKAVRLAMVLYSRVLSRIESGNFEVFAKRAKTTRAEKLTLAARVLSGLA